MGWTNQIPIPFVVDSNTGDGSITIDPSSGGTGFAGATIFLDPDNQPGVPAATPAYLTTYIIDGGIFFPNSARLRLQAPFWEKNGSFDAAAMVELWSPETALDTGTIRLDAYNGPVEIASGSLVLNYDQQGFGGLFIANRRIGWRVWNANGLSPGTSTTSATYVDTGVSLDIIKLNTSTRLKVTITATSWAQTASGEPRFAIQINGTDYDVAGMLINTIAAHHQIAGVLVLPDSTPVASQGGYTCKLRWRRVSGTGTLQFGTDDRYSITIEEIANVP